MTQRIGLATVVLMFIGVVVFPFHSMAQETPVTDGGQYTGCEGFIVDTGLSASDYGNNEDITYTICPEAPETIVTLSYVVFNLGAGDTMYVYQGADTNAPLVGAFAGSDLNAQSIFTDPGNASGCITIVFVSDGSETGDFAMAISCGEPCDSPVAIIETDEPIPVLACVGEPITFDGSNSEFADGASLASYYWDFDDGSIDNSSGLVVEHSFDTPGEYVVQLYLTDDSDCSSFNLPDAQVLVSTTPSFEESTDTLVMCLNEAGLVGINGVVEGTLWNGQPESPIGGYLEIPDDQTQCFSSEILFGNFNPGQTVTSAADIESVFVNMEHSFIGDLVITLICPSGNSVIMHEQGGGGTYAGEPVDGDGQTIIPGVGYDYWWAPDASLGTWAEEGAFQSTLPSGTYSSVQSFNNLIGCPLNGIWTLQICDLWGADNGVVFDWTLQFESSLYPDVTSFTPTFGADCDSTYWTGPDISDTNDNCNEAILSPTEPGTYTYTFNATDNFGCTYTHDAIVIVELGPQAAVENDFVSFCGDPIELQAFVSNSEPGVNYQYEWTPATGLDNPNIANPSVINMSTNQITYTVFVYEAGEEICGSETTVTVEYVEPITSQVEASVCQGEPYELPGGAVVFDGGIYSDTLSSALTGCDSIVVTTLDVNPVYDIDIEASICGGGGYQLPDGTTVTESGIYPVSFTTATGCDSTITTNVTIVSVDAGEYDPICPPNYPINMALSGTVSPEDPTSTVTWSGPSQIEFANPNSLNTVIVASENGIYTVQLTDSRCPENPAIAQLVLRTPPQVTLTNIPFVCVGEDNVISVQLSGDFAQPPYYWTDEDNIFSGESGTSITINGDYFADNYPLPLENYLVEVTVPGIAPCPFGSDTTSFDVLDCEIIIPNVFTPNGDANNPDFEISGIESYPGSRIIILNRWGKVVYENDSYGEPYWDGTHYKSGIECSDGVYYYELILGRTNEVFKGSVTILRD